DSFFYNNKFYITHLERFSFEIYLSSFTNKNDISTKKIGETAFPPKIFLNNNILNCFFKDKNKNTFSLKSINLNDDKVEEIDGENDISFFDVSSSKNGYYSIIWQNEKDLKNFYISIINNEFTPLSNVNLLKFNQKVHPPKTLLNDKYFNLIFSIDYTNYYFRYPLGDDIRNYSQVKFPEEFHSYNMDFFTYLESIYIVILKKTIENRLKEKSDIIEILFYDNNFDYCISRKITTIEGEIKNFSFATLNESLYLFWLEKIKDKSVIRSSKIIFSKE
nr:hypothetical protein [Spirochaetota bacterium]